MRLVIDECEGCSSERCVSRGHAPGLSSPVVLWRCFAHIVRAVLDAVCGREFGVLGRK